MGERYRNHFFVQIASATSATRPLSSAESSHLRRLSIIPSFHAITPFNHLRLVSYSAMSFSVLHWAWQKARSKVVAAVVPRLSPLHVSLQCDPSKGAVSLPTNVCVRGKHGAKSHQGAKKRFRLLKCGEIVRGHAGKSHNTGHRSSVQMSRLRVSTTVAPTFVRRIRRLVLGL